MKKTNSTIYVTVKLMVEHEDINENDIGVLLDDVGSNLDYSFDYEDEDGTKIVSTEITDINLKY